VVKAARPLSTVERAEHRRHARQMLDVTQRERALQTMPWRDRDRLMYDLIIRMVREHGIDGGEF
jgi:hypothetical protein